MSLMSMGAMAIITDSFIANVTNPYSTSQGNYNLLNNASYYNSSWLEFVNSDCSINMLNVDEDLPQFSYFLWINANEGDDRDNINLMGDGDSNANNWVLRKDRQLRLVEGIFDDYYSIKKITLNTWQFIGFTYNGSQTIMYINGKNCSSGTATGTINPSDLLIGDNCFSSRSFNGSIAQAIIYNRSLNNSEIVQLYQSGFSGLRTEDYFSMRSSSESFLRINSPSGMYYNNITYVTFAGDFGDPYLTRYNHTSDSWMVEQKVGTNPLVEDSHGSPSIYIDNLGYIHIFFGSHAGVQQYLKSDNPEDVSSFTLKNNFATTSTYPSIFQLSDDYLYVVHRTGGTTSDWEIKNSSDYGDNWDLLDTISDDTNPDYFYWNAEKGYNDYIHFAGISVNYTNGIRYNIYYFYRDNLGNYYNISGGTITLPINDSFAKSNLLVYASSQINSTNIPALAINSSNKPLIVFNTGNATSSIYKFKSARWGGSAWVISDIGAMADSKFDFCELDIRNDSYYDAYLVTNEADYGRGGSMDRWSSYDSGSTWNRNIIVLNESITGEHYNDPKKIFNSPFDNFRIVFDEYSLDFNDFTLKAFMYGDSGLINRNYSFTQSEFNSPFIRYMFNENEGYEVFDSSGNNNHGTMQNATRINDSNKVLLVESDYSLITNQFTLLEDSLDRTYLELDYDDSSSCFCPGLNSNWEINLSDNCIIDFDCDIGNGNISFVGGTIFNGTITANSLSNMPPTLTIDSNANLILG